MGSACFCAQTSSGKETKMEERFMSNADRLQSAGKAFAQRHHKAVLVQNADRFCVIDWGAENGSSDYYVSYILDKEQGNLCIAGDLGSCIASWYHDCRVHDFVQYVEDARYFIGKMACTTNKCRYDDQDVLDDIKGTLAEYASDEADDFRKGWDEFAELAPDCIDDQTGFHPDEYMRDYLDKYLDTDDWWEWIPSWERSIDQKVFLWAEGLIMAVSQLEEEGLLGQED